MISILFIFCFCSYPVPVSLHILLWGCDLKNTSIADLSTVITKCQIFWVILKSWGSSNLAPVRFESRLMTSLFFVLFSCNQANDDNENNTYTIWRMCLRLLCLFPYYFLLLSCCIIFNWKKHKKDSFTDYRRKKNDLKIIFPLVLFYQC